MTELLTALFGFIGGVFLGPLFTRNLKKKDQRAKMNFTITNTVVSPKDETSDVEFSLDWQTMTQLKRCPITPGFDKPLDSLERANQYIKSINTTKSSHKEVLDYMNSLASKPSILSNNLNADEKRAQLLIDISRYSEIDVLLKLAVMNNRAKIPTIYNDPHPDEWKAGAKAHISIDSTHTYNLTEVDIEKGRSEKREKDGHEAEESYVLSMEATNILRRFFIHMDNDHLKWLMGCALKEGEGWLLELEELQKGLEKRVDFLSPDYLNATCFVTNNGDKPVAIMSTGLLKFPRIGNTMDKTGTLKVELISGAKPIELKGNSSVIFSLYSLKPIAKETIQDDEGKSVISGDTLIALMKSQILECSASMMAIHYDGKEECIVSKRHVFGVPQTEKLIEELRGKLG